MHQIKPVPYHKYIRMIFLYQIFYIFLHCDYKPIVTSPYRECYFLSYYLYMHVTSSSINDPPLLERTSRHNMLSFPHSFFTKKTYLPKFHIEKLLLDSAHDAHPVYEDCRREDISPFIDFNPGHTGQFTYKDDFTIDDDGVSICKMGLLMHKDGYETAKHQAKYRCQKANRRQGCFC